MTHLAKEVDMPILSPMVVQYLVGLCCLRRNPEAVDVIIGDWVVDSAANESRDVDITVTLTEADGSIRAFKAYEVKKEAKKLSVNTVEGLCLKLKDMPAITHRAIVSASGFTRGSVAKAAKHNVELFELKPWTKSVADQFPHFAEVGKIEEHFQFTSNLLFWIGARLQVRVPTGPPSFTLKEESPIFAADGSRHREFPTYKKFKDMLLYRSTSALWEIDPAQTISRIFPHMPDSGDKNLWATPPWPHTHTLQVKEDQLYLKFDNGLALVDAVTVTGHLQWQKRKIYPAYYVLEQVPTGNIFAGAIVGDWGKSNGELFAWIFSPDSRTLGTHRIKLLEKHKNAIRELSLRDQK